MNKEQLMALGLTEEQATAVLKAHKVSIDGNYIPKDTFDAEREKVKTLNGEVSTRDTQIKELGGFKGTAEELTTKLADLETQNKASITEYEGKLLKVTQEAAIKSEIMGKVVDLDDVLPKLDVAKIVFKDGKVESGLTEQLETLKKTKPHYFVAAEDTKPGGFLFGKTPADGKDQANDGKDEASQFGKDLASQRTKTDVIAAKAAESYFK